MSDYKKSYEAFKEASTTKAYSKSGLQKLTNAYWNDTEYKSHTIVPTSDGNFQEITTCPAKDIRDGLKSVVKKSFGIDATEANKLDTAELPHSVTDAMLDGISFVQKDYLDTGRALPLPMTNSDESAMKIFIKSADEVSFETRKIEQKDGEWVSTPTGEVITHKKHKAISASNKVPDWLSFKKKK